MHYVEGVPMATYVCISGGALGRKSLIPIVRHGTIVQWDDCNPVELPEVDTWHIASAEVANSIAHEQGLEFYLYPQDAEQISWLARYWDINLPVPESAPATDTVVRPGDSVIEISFRQSSGGFHVEFTLFDFLDEQEIRELNQWSSQKAPW